MILDQWMNRTRHPDRNTELLCNLTGKLIHELSANELHMTRLIHLSIDALSLQDYTRTVLGAGKPENPR